MIKLSHRLQLIFELIEQGETMADIGTDHGFLPMALWESGKCAKVVLSDVNPGPLEKARANMGKAGIGIETEMRLGNGLETIDQAEVTTIVIAGMGGVLMTQILGADLEKTRSFKKIILQPRNGQDKLRYWLISRGFSIQEERLVKEGQKICDILLVVPQSTLISQELFPEDDPRYLLPDPQKTKDRQLMIQLIQQQIRKEDKVIESIQRSGRKPEAQILLQRAEDRKTYFVGVLNQEVNGNGGGNGNYTGEH